MKNKDKSSWQKSVKRKIKRELSDDEIAAVVAENFLAEAEGGLKLKRRLRKARVEARRTELST